MFYSTAKRLKYYFGLHIHNFMYMYNMYTHVHDACFHLPCFATWRYMYMLHAEVQDDYVRIANSPTEYSWAPTHTQGMSQLTWCHIITSYMSTCMCTYTTCTMYSAGMGTATGHVVTAGTASYLNYRLAKLRVSRTVHMYMFMWYLYKLQIMQSTLSILLCACRYPNDN